MHKCLFVLGVEDMQDLKKLAKKLGKTRSALVREGIGLLKARYNPIAEVYTKDDAEYIPNSFAESG